MRRVKKVSIIAACAALVAGIVSVAWPASAATTAAAGIAIVMENSGKCLNVAGASTANSAKVIQYTCAPAATNDKWILVPQNGGVYWVQNVASGKCLTVQGASTANNASLIQYACTTGGNETWRVESQIDRPTMRLSSVLSHLCVDVPGRSTANNVNLIQYTCQPGEGTPNERVTMPPTTSAAVVNRTLTTDQPVAVLQGGRPASGGTAPVSYSWFASDHEWETLTDFNPDVFQPDPSAPAATGWATANAGAGYTGRPAAALLDDKRVQIVAHEEEAGDVQYADETQPGAGQYGPVFDLGGAMDAQPTVGTYAPGRLAYYAIIGGALWYDPQTPGDTYPAYGGWRSLGGTDLAGVPAVAPNGTGAQIFTTSTAGQIRTAKLDGTTLGDWTNVGGPGRGDPVVVPLKGEHYFVTSRSTNGTVAYLEQQADGTWPADWTTIPGVSTGGNPTAVMGSADGRIEIAMTSADKVIYVSQETAPSSGQFGGWVLVSDPDKPGSVATSDPTAVVLDIPSGQTFAIVFQNADSDTNGPYEIVFPTDWTAPTTPPLDDATRAGLLYRSVPTLKKSTTK